MACKPHPKERSPGARLEGWEPVMLSPILRDAALRAAPQDEGFALKHLQRLSWMMSLIFSRVLVRFSVQPSSSYLTSLTDDIAGMPPGSLVRSTSLRVGRR